MSSPGPKRFLVTAGNTRERIDAVRDWGNIFTGNTGLSIAEALAGVGQVDLLTSNRAHLANLEQRAFAHAIRGTHFNTHAELRAVLAEKMSGQPYDAIFMTAAVSDYAPARVYAVLDRKPGADGQEQWTVADVQAGKVKSHHARIAVLGEPTEKIVDLFRTEWRHAGLLVKFKLEVGVSREELLQIGEASRRASGADYLVANALDMVDGPGAGAFLLSDAGHEWVPRAELAMRLAKLVARAGADSRAPRASKLPHAVEVFASFRQYLGPRFSSAGIGLEFSQGGAGGVRFLVEVPNDARAEIERGIVEGVAQRFPTLFASGGITVTRVEHADTESSPIAFNRAARMAIEQAYSLTTAVDR